MSDTVLIAKMIGQQAWIEVANPIYKDPHPEFLADQLLKCSASEYVEYVIAGAVYRVVRRHVLPAYGIEAAADAVLLSKVAEYEPGDTHFDEEYR